MKRIFEIHNCGNGHFERKIVTDTEVTTQLVNNETTAEARKKYGDKLSQELVDKCNGEIQGWVFKERKDTISDLGWSSAKEFIKNRLGHYKEVI